MCVTFERIPSHVAGPSINCALYQAIQSKLILPRARPFSLPFAPLAMAPPLPPVLPLAAPSPWHAIGTNRPSHGPQLPQFVALQQTSRQQTGAAAQAHPLVAVEEGTGGTPTGPGAPQHNNADMQQSSIKAIYLLWSADSQAATGVISTLSTALQRCKC